MVQSLGTEKEGTVTIRVDRVENAAVVDGSVNEGEKEEREHQS